MRLVGKFAALWLWVIQRIIELSIVTAYLSINATDIVMRTCVKATPGTGRRELLQEKLKSFFGDCIYEEKGIDFGGEESMGF